MMHFNCHNIKKYIIQYLIKCDHFLTIIYISHHNIIKVLKTKTKKKEIKSKSQQISLKSQ